MTKGHHQMLVFLASPAKRWSTGQVPCQLSTGGGLHTCCRWINRNCTTVPQNHFEVLSLTALSCSVCQVTTSHGVCGRWRHMGSCRIRVVHRPRTEQFLLLICSLLRKSSSSRFNSRPSSQFTPIPLLLASLTIAHYFGKQD